MARFDVKLLDAGDVFPDLPMKLTSGAEIRARQPTAHAWNVILFYRGAWCPFCVGQLESFQNGLEKLAAEDIGVLAASVDSLEKAEEAAGKSGAQFPIAYDLSIEEIGKATGAFYDADPSDKPPYIHATGFVINPKGKVILSVYSSGAIGRLAWQDVLALVKYLKAHPQSQ